MSYNGSPDAPEPDLTDYNQDEHVLVDDFVGSEILGERRAQCVFIQSLVPAVYVRPREEWGEAEVSEITATRETIELWMIAELDAGIEALVDGAYFEVDELVRSTPTPKTGALPGLAMVHYERVVYWTEASAEAFEVDAEEEDALDWADLDPELDAEIEADAAFDADEGDLCGPEAEAYARAVAAKLDAAVPLPRDSIVDEIKVAYLTLDQCHSTAYIDAETGVGINKHTDEAVALRWDASVEFWIQTA